jgi:hypothetical protein
MGDGRNISAYEMGDLYADTVFVVGMLCDSIAIDDNIFK